MKLLLYYIQRSVLALLVAAVIGMIGAQPSQAANPNDFIVKSFEADYYLTRDQNKVSHMRVEEKIVAQFPNFDQNHGILRAIPETYQEHPVKLKIESVTDQVGKALPYDKSSSNNNVVLKIGDADTYVHGRQTYHIAYTLQQVTNTFDDRDEIYWDVNGNEWPQAFESVTARLHIPADLAGAVGQDKACFTGGYGSTEANCSILLTQQADGALATVSTRGPLQANETLTFALAFEKGTFAAYQPDSTDIIIFVLTIVFLGVLPPLVTLIIVLRKWRTYGRDPKGKGTIVPEYLPPKEASVLLSGIVLKEDFNTTFISMQIIDLAVRHYVKIYEVKKERALLPDETSYDLELVRDPADLRLEERRVVELLFGATAKPGDKVSLKEFRKKQAKTKQVEGLGEEAVEQLTKAGYFPKNPKKAKLPYIIAGIVLLVVGFIFMPITLGFGVAGLILLIASNFMPARTQKGVELRDYLHGLQMYMKLAETERIKVLQSPHGALTEKVIDPNNKAQLVKLYEKLLPYAMLFGIEKEWVKQFADLYQQPPDWYSGSSPTFNAILFAGALHNFNTASNQSFAPPSSSSSGGSGGGGFSGGGGGGGGGGGW